MLREFSREWKCKIPEKVIEVGLMQKARFDRFGCDKNMNSNIYGK
jgi:hypothetical protein